jgi:hypothetical protein
MAKPTPEEISRMTEEEAAKALDKLAQMKKRNDQREKELRVIINQIHARLNLIAHVKNLRNV